MHPTWEVTMVDMWQYRTAHRPAPLPSSKGQKENSYWGVVRIYKPNQVSRIMPFTMLISVCFLYVRKHHMSSWAYRGSHDRLLIIFGLFVQRIPLAWYNIIIWVQQLLKIPPPSTNRVNFQVNLVPLPESILKSSTGLRTGSESALQEQL